MSTADAVARETAWLNTTVDDGLPILVADGGGPFDTIGGYYPRTPYEERRTIYVLLHQIQHQRFGARRVLNRYPFRLILWWPILAADGSAETEAQAFDSGIDLLLQRIEGPMGDKTHGGRFLSAAQLEGTSISVDYTDPEQTLQLGGLRAEVTYTADDIEINA
jgi:hypothetical protein